MKWQTKHINLGDLKVGKKIEITFVPLEELKEINYMKSSCGCSTPSLVNGKILVKYTPGSVPYHLIKRGWYKSTKTITIIYKDGSQDKLSFSAIVHKKNIIL